MSNKDKVEKMAATDDEIRDTVCFGVEGRIEMKKVNRWQIRSARSPIHGRDRRST